MAVLLETNILVAAIKGILSSVMLSEWETGVIKNACPERNRHQHLALVDHLELVEHLALVPLAQAWPWPTDRSAPRLSAKARRSAPTIFGSRPRPRPRR